MQLSRNTLFTRHDQGENNLWKLYGGQGYYNLTICGMSNAVLRGEEIAQEYSIGLIVCSALQRSIQTGQIIASVSQYAGEIVQIPELNEVDSGEWTGKTREKGHSNFDKALISQHGEKIPDLQKRGVKVIQILDGLNQGLPKDQQLLVIGHRSFTAVIFAILNGQYDSIEKFRKTWKFGHNDILLPPDKEIWLPSNHKIDL